MAYTEPDTIAYAEAKAHANTCAITYVTAKTDADACTMAHAEAMTNATAMATSGVNVWRTKNGTWLTRAEVKAEVIVKAKAKAKAEAKVVDMAKICSEAEARVKPYVDAYAKAKAEAEVLTPLYNLATDCLRLSMHFFHPIQQCAQQVYHTAVPLSPTSSWLHKSYLQSVADNQLSYVTTFSGAPSTWGSLLRTINLRPKQLTCIATSVQGIITACENLVDVYDEVTFVFRQSLQTPEKVTKIQGSPDGSILFFAHSFSVTMWDMQTGGHINTFTTESRIIDIAISTTGDHIACCSSDDSVVFWNTHTNEGKGVWNSQPVITICWMSHRELAIATQSTFYIHDIVDCKTSDRSIPGHVWGMVYLEGKGEFLVGTSHTSPRVGQKCFFVTIRYRQWCRSEPGELGLLYRQSPMYNGQLSSPTLMGEDILCITSPTNGVQLFNISSYRWTNTPPLLGTVTSMAVSLNRNLVVQTKDSIQIFTSNILTSGEAHIDTHLSHIYPLGENHIICLQPNRLLTLLEFETLQELHPDDSTSLPGPLLINQSASTHPSFDHGLATEFSVSVVVGAWQSGTPLPDLAEATNKDVSLSGLSPNHTRVVKVYTSPPQELRVKDAKNRATLAKLPLEDTDLGMGKVYNLVFDSETRFYLKIDGPGWHVQIPYNIITSPSGRYSHVVIKGEPVHLSEPRPTSPYTLDANCEWVTDAESRKICWISPGNVRRGDGGHFWAGLSLIMVGDDGVVRKLTFREPVRGREGGCRDRGQRHERPRRRIRKHNMKGGVNG